MLEISSARQCDRPRLLCCLALILGQLRYARGSKRIFYGYFGHLATTVKVDIGHVNLINFLRTIRRCSEAVSSVKLISCKTINPKCKAMCQFNLDDKCNKSTYMYIQINLKNSSHYSSLVSSSYIRAGPMQPPGNQVRARIRHGTPWVERYGVSEEEDGNRRNIIQLQIVSRVVTSPYNGDNE